MLADRLTAATSTVVLSFWFAGDAARRSDRNYRVDRGRPRSMVSNAAFGRSVAAAIRETSLHA
jgi:hypothetical protein